MIVEDKILIDVGSATVKVYKFSDFKLTSLFTKTIFFKNGFTPEKGISQENKLHLINLFLDIKQQYPHFVVKTYATAIFRKLNEKQKTELIDEVFRKTNIFFNIISHELENFYLELAMTGKYENKEPILMLNIGGGSTELVVLNDHKPIERQNINFGITTVLSEFPEINQTVSPISLNKIVTFVKAKLPELVNIVHYAFYNGGELKYMQLARYPLQDNYLFKDKFHPQCIDSKDFARKNIDIFEKISLQDLENLMPSDPKWMHGARACSAIAQAIFEKYQIRIIIPSNSNLIDGVVRQEFQKVTLSGSFRKHLHYILNIKKYLNSKNIQVISPRFSTPKNPGEEFVVFEGEEESTPIELERYHLNAIDQSDALVICNPEGYVGASAMIEIGYAHSIGKRIIFIEKPEEFMLNTLPAEVGF